MSITATLTFADKTTHSLQLATSEDAQAIARMHAELIAYAGECGAHAASNFAGITVGLHQGDKSAGQVRVASIADARLLQRYVDESTAAARAAASPGVVVNLVDRNGEATTVRAIRVASVEDAEKLRDYVQMSALRAHVAARASMPVVNVQPAVSVALPTRRTETTVKRDASGAIVKTTQIETTVRE